MNSFFKVVALLVALVALCFVTHASAQQPTPAQVVVQAANVSSTAAAAPKQAASNSSSPSVQAAIKALEQTKAVNEETLKKQEATLQQLDELQKAAEQLKVFAKRG